MSYAQTSFWLETCGEDLTPRKPLSGDITVDVAILGGGYSGLWTAYYLLQAEPGLEVAILEAEVCGYGASGRNGGWCSPRYPINPDVVERRYDVETARLTVTAMKEAVAEVGRVCAEEGIDAQFRNVGILSLARGEAQMASVRGSYAVYDRLGLLDGGGLLDADALRSRVRIEGAVGAFHSPTGAAVHPAKLARGLARAVEAKGAQIYEQSPVTALSVDGQPGLATTGGTVRARRAVVAAAEAYLPKVKGFGRKVLPMSSSIVLTKPLSKDQWAQIGWAGGEGLGSQAFTVDYLTKTSDGRILYGSRGAPYLYGSATDGGEAAMSRTHTAMREELRRWFPVLGDDDFSHAWSGFLGVSRDWEPTVSFDPLRKIASLHGYTGRGVSTTNLAARVLAEKILGRPSDLQRLPLARHSAPAWEPEPFRYLGVRYVQDAFKRMDAARDAGRPAPIDANLAKQLSAP